MDRRGHTGAAPKRIFQIDRPAMLFQKVAERLVGKLLKILHLVVAEKVQLPPSFFVDLNTFARHRFAFFARSRPRSFSCNGALVQNRRIKSGPFVIDATAHLDLI